jgi:hypothetical protein
MTKQPLKLAVVPPRDYVLRDAYDRRVWRTPITVVCRELFFWALGVLTLGVVYNHIYLMVGGALGGVLLIVFGLLASWHRNQGRVALVQTAPAVKGTLGVPRRVPFLHEVLRGQRESTYVLPYTFQTESGDQMTGRLWICGCARTYLPAKSIEWILYNSEKPQRSLPLRVAVMVAPH